MKVSPRFPPAAQQAEPSKPPQQPFQSNNVRVSARIHELHVVGLPWSSHFMPLWADILKGERCRWSPNFSVTRAAAECALHRRRWLPLPERSCVARKAACTYPDRIYCCCQAFSPSLCRRLSWSKILPCLSSAGSPFVENVKRNVCIQEFKFGFLACLVLSLAAPREVLSTQEI